VPYAHAGLQAFGVATYFDQFDARRKLFAAIMKHHTIGIQTSDQGNHILHVVRVAEQAVTHMAATGIVHLPVLDVKPRIGQQINIARMVVMQMGQHHILNISRRNT
jgi:hypothetical protein